MILVSSTYNSFFIVVLPGGRLLSTSKEFREAHKQKRITHPTFRSRNIRTVTYIEMTELVKRRAPKTKVPK